LRQQELRLTDLIVRDVAILDGTGRQPAGRSSVIVRDGRIESIGVARARGLATIDGSGCTLMPGLTDAHVHFALIGRGGRHGDMPWIEHVLAVTAMIEAALDAGFTTVRDAGGLEPAWARLTDSGRIRGPRILPSGSPLSQTGGHGDDRLAHEAVHAGGGSIPGLVARTEIVDGPDAVRRAAREQLRRGATQIKVFASGGLASPTDPLESLQLSVEEIAAAVEVARDWGTYVLAHCHTSPAMERALDAGVRSIEHGSMLEPSTASRIAAAGAYLVPTLATIEELIADPAGSGLTPAKQARATQIYDAMTASVRLAAEAGVTVASGSDLIGPTQLHRGRELVLKAAILGAEAAIKSATTTNAALFGLADRIGTIEPGKDADLILVAGDPLGHIELLDDPNRIPVVIKAGVVVKDREGRAKA
jgi:imidazolonepropionase-like amidohydrolase